MLQEMGMETGVHLDQLLACAAEMPGLVGHDVPGAILRAGKSDARFPVPGDFEVIQARALARGGF